MKQEVRICDVCGNKITDGSPIEVILHDVNFNRDYQRLDICEPCRYKIANFLNSLRGNNET